MIFQVLFFSKHWCCHDDGLLLQQFIEEGLDELSTQLHPEEREVSIKLSP